jgi:hypothetical protein
MQYTLQCSVYHRQVWSLSRTQRDFCEFDSLFMVKWEKQHRASTARRELLWGSGALLPQSLANPLAREIPGLAATASPEILAHLQLLTNWIWEGCGGHLRFAFRISVSFLFDFVPSR